MVFGKEQSVMERRDEKVVSWKTTKEEKRN
jgi:hypothetical protein